MKINALSFALAGALTTSAWYTAIILLIKTWPYETLQFISTSHMIPHLENLIPYIKITSTGIFTGISIHFLSTYFCFLLMALLYNLFTSLTNK
jgi:hypothetical protein